MCKCCRKSNKELKLLELRKAPIVGEEVKAPPRKKDTKHWCKGKVGREHQLRWVKEDHSWYWWSIETCENCGKKFRYCYNSVWRRPAERCICGLHKEV